MKTNLQQNKQMFKSNRQQQIFDGITECNTGFLIGRLGSTTSEIIRFNSKEFVKLKIKWQY